MTQTPDTRPDTDSDIASDEPIAPETVNTEQDDEDAQAQTVADDALTRATSVLGTDSDHVASAPGEADAQDLVDHMKQMETSGVIDMSAYEGEPSHDDEPDTYGGSEDGDDPVEDSLSVISE